MKPARKLSFACLCILGLVMACVFTPSTPTRVPTPGFQGAGTPIPLLPGRPVLIDTDMAADDWMAILYLLQRTDVDVLAITVTGTGEAHCDPGIANAAGLVALAAHDPIPVACGQETPLQGDHTFPLGWRDAMDRMLDIPLPAGTNPWTGDPALDLFAATLEAAPQPVTVLALGPLTNLGELVTQRPDLLDRIAMVYVMGGAVHVPGNLQAANNGNLAAEWNVYVDPAAANLLLTSGAPVTLVPLDATNQVPMTPAYYQTVAAGRLTPEADFVYDVLSRMTDSINSGTYFWWDPLTAVLLADESLATFEQDEICVVEQEGRQSGQTEVRAGCPEVRVAVGADASRFEQVFLDTLNNSSPGPAATEIPFPEALTGTWAGTARNGDFEMQVAATILEGCRLGEVCGWFEIPTIDCAGDWVWIGMDGEMYEFEAVDKSDACGEGRDFLQPQPGGSLLYLSQGEEYGETRGVLQRAP